MKIVFPDCKSINPGDISWDCIRALGTFTHYGETTPDRISERIGNADVVIVDSLPITRDVMSSCPNLKMIAIAATGYNHIDLTAAAEYNIAVTNVPAYSTDTVAQHTIALLLSLTNRKWPVIQLAGKSMGIIGYGNIGKKVAAIGHAMGMKINIYSKDRDAAIKSDVVSLHCPLDKNNTRMVDANFIKQMKDGAFFINTARGGLVDEQALYDALQSGKIAGAGLDVVTVEPVAEDNPLLDLDNCIITPHIAFTSIEARETVIETCANNIKDFIAGKYSNRL